jgi:penicillin amidase
MGDPLHDSEVLAARWAMSDPGFDFAGLLKLYAATTASEARAAIREYDSISGNFCFADTAGDIGYQYSGRVPRRPAYLVPVPGWDGEHEWQGWIAKEELPWQQNPDTGYIATANNRPAPADYPHYLSLGGATARADRLNEVLRSRDVWSPQDMPSIQGDLVSPVARTLVARYLSVAASSEAGRHLQDLMRGWDLSVEVDSRAALVYMEVTQQLIALTVASIDDDDSNAETPDRRTLLLRVLRLDDRSFLGSFASWDEAVARALEDASASLVVKYGSDEGRWRWGEAHWMTWRHNLGRDPKLADVLNLPDTPVGGDGATLWATQARYGRGSDHGVSYRQVFDMSALNGSPIVMPPGNSGQPGSAHYADSVEMWRALEYHPLYFEWADIEANAEAEQALVPLSDG